MRTISWMAYTSYLYVYSFHYTWNGKLNYLSIAVAIDKETNDAVCAHYTWVVQTRYTPVLRFTLTLWSVSVNSHNHDKNTY